MRSRPVMTILCTLTLALFAAGPAPALRVVAATTGSGMTLAFAPSPIAPAASLHAGQIVPVTLTAVDHLGHPLAHATVYLSFLAAKGGGTAQVGKIPLLPAARGFQTDASGQIAVTYHAPSKLPGQGTDTLMAANAATAPSVVTKDVYGFAAALVAPSFANYAAPQSGANAQLYTAGEPSIGADWQHNVALFQSTFQTYKVSWDDSVSPATATWTDVSTPVAALSLDPIGFLDQHTNRYFASFLTGQDSTTSFTDDDGATWTPSQGGGIPSGVDHQTIGGGPYHANTLGMGPLTSYPDAVYYCSQDIATAFCARSDDGGLTFGTGIPIYNKTECGGLHGHVKVAPDGTVYVPNKSCTDAGGIARPGVAVSTDNGLTWTVRTIPDGSVPSSATDPSIGIGTNGTIYEGYQSGDGHPRIAVSHDQGQTWSPSVDVGAGLGIKNTVFPEVVAGDDNRAAFAFLGSTTDGDHQASSFPGTWDLYVAFTYDGGKTWTTMDATPGDPVQRGPICTSGTTCTGNDRNLLDFNDITITKTGRVLVGYADGCTGVCVTDPSQNTNSAVATISRQTAGKGLLAAYDAKGFAGG